jgi:biotin operon repressor
MSSYNDPNNGYYNSTTVNRRQISHLLEENNLEKLKTFKKLDLSCPYNNRGPLSCVYKAVEYDNSPNFDTVRYLVEERKLTSDTALVRALECSRIEIAKYLKEKGFYLSEKRNHVYSLESMKLVKQWSVQENGKYAFTEEAFDIIMFHWN